VLPGEDWKFIEKKRFLDTTGKGLRSYCLKLALKDVLEVTAGGHCLVLLDF